MIRDAKVKAGFGRKSDTFLDVPAVFFHPVVIFLLNF